MTSTCASTFLWKLDCARSSDTRSPCIMTSLALAIWFCWLLLLGRPAANIRAVYVLMLIRRKARARAGAKARVHQCEVLCQAPQVCSNRLCLMFPSELCLLCLLLLVLSSSVSSAATPLDLSFFRSQANKFLQNGRTGRR